MRYRRRGVSIGAALAAVLALVLHAAVSVLSPAHAGPPALDAFGNVICAPGGGATQDGHGSLPPCCALGCAAISPALPAPPDIAVLMAEPATISPARPRVRDLVPVSTKDHDPGSPRAPPLPA